MHDDDVLAWVLRDDAAPAGTGPLAGLAFGVKDTIDVRGWPTGYGLLDRTPQVAAVDAWCVAALRAAGATPAGKTHTTPLASRDPAVTRHPRLAGRTPGGSSAGSAAAVAAGHVPFALGTQTLGSVLRPSAFCGVVGFKPTYGRIPTGGVAPLAPSFDTVGVIAANVDVAARASDVLLGPLAAHGLGERIAIGWAPDTFAGRFAPAVLASLERFVDLLDPSRFAVTTVSFAAAVEAMREAVTVVMAFEAHAALAPFRDAGPLPPGIDALIARGADIAYGAYRDALETRRRTRDDAIAALRPFDAVLLPIADVPPSRETTGDAMPQAPWTAWGGPSLALPVDTLPDGAPVAIGIVAAPDDDAIVLEVARRIERHL